MRMTNCFYAALLPQRRSWQSSWPPPRHSWSRREVIGTSTRISTPTCVRLSCSGQPRRWKGREAEAPPVAARLAAPRSGGGDSLGFRSISRSTGTAMIPKEGLGCIAFYLVRVAPAARLAGQIIRPKPLARSSRKVGKACRRVAAASVPTPQCWRSFRGAPQSGPPRSIV